MMGAVQKTNLNFRSLIRELRVGLEATPIFAGEGDLDAKRVETFTASVTETEATPAKYPEEDEVESKS